MLGLHYTAYIPLAALALLAASLAQLAFRRVDVAWKLSRIGFAAVLIGWPIYVIPFVLLDYRLYEVYWTTSPGLPLWMRIASSWAGGGGSLYLFAVISAAAGLYILRGTGASPRPLALLAGITAAGIAAAFLNNAFTLLPEEPVSGAGLNPLLKSPWLYPHPLSTFGGYALLAVAAAALLSGERRRGIIVYELGWAALTLGIMLGGYWSYETFGWGGYWAWDPVETSELMVWLIATLLPHVLATTPSLTRFNAAWLLSSVFLAMYVTRTGISPLHSFSAPGVGALILLAAATAALLLGLYELSRSIEAGIAEARLHIRSRKPYTLGLLAASLLLLAASIFVYGTLAAPSYMAAAGLEVSVPQMSSGIRYFHPVLYPITILVLAVIPLAFLGDKLGWRGYLALTISTAVASAVLALAVLRGTLILAPLSPTETNVLMAFGLPWAGVAAAATAYYIAALVVKKAITGHAARLGSIAAIHLGLALTVMGVLVSGTYAYNEAYMWTLQLKPGDTVQLPGGITLVFTGYQYGISSSLVDIYTNYVGRSTTYFLGWEAIATLRSDMATVYKLYLEGVREANENKTLKRLLELREVGEIVLNTTLSYETNTSLEIYDFESNARITLLRDADSRVVIERPRIGFLTVRSPSGETFSIITVVIPSNMTIVFERASLERHVIGIHQVAELQFNPPLELVAGNYTVTIEGAALLPEALVTAGRGEPAVVEEHRLHAIRPSLQVNGTVTMGGAAVEMPAILDRAATLYLLVKENPHVERILEEINETSLRELLLDPARITATIQSPACLEAPHGCTGYVAAPRAVPETAWLDVGFRLEAPSGDQELSVRIRFEAYGEIQGIHGLVPKVVPVTVGLDEVYIVISPPVVRGVLDDRIAYHELLVYYLHEAFKGLRVEERLALAALMAGGYNIDAAREAPTERALLLESSLIDLYILAEKFDPQNTTIDAEGLTLQVKVVPGVKLVWAGPTVMAIASILAALASLHVSRRTG